MLEILTAILVIITGVYAWLTYRIARANEKVVGVMEAQNIDLNRPYVSIVPFTIPGDPMIYLRISNTGRTAARNLRMQIDRDFFQFAQEKDDRNLAKLNIFQNEMATFPPGAQLSYYLGTGPSIFGKESERDLSPNVFTITASYSFLDRTVNEATTIDLRPYFRTVDSDPLTSRLEELVKAIKELKDKLK